MKRRHWFEFNEIDWLPAIMRGLITDYLVTVGRLTQSFSPLLPLLLRALEHGRNRQRIIDLCSGSGGPWIYLADQVERLSDSRVEIVLSDLYPDPAGATGAKASRLLTRHAQPVDATDLKKCPAGLLTVINAFHQFRPDKARELLRCSVEQGQSIAVFEMLQRRWRALGLVVLTPVLVLILTPFTRPFAWSRLLLTYVIPVAPVLITWDTLVSMLRCYRPDELMTMARSIDNGRFDWHAGSYWHHGSPVTFLVGYPLAGQPA